MSNNAAIVAALNDPTPPSRAKLQQWAKKFGVKANLASDAILAQLKDKLAAESGGDGPAPTVGSKRKADEPAATIVEEPDDSTESAPSAKKQKAKPKGKAKTGKQEAEEVDAEMPQAASSSSSAAAEPEAKAKDSASSSASSAPPARSGPVFAGMSFCLTGDFSTGKTGLEALIERNGGKITSSVTKSLTYLVCGTAAAGPFGGKSGPGSSKCKEARKAKKPVVNEDFILKMVSDAKSKASDCKAHPAFKLVNKHLPTVLSELVIQHLPPRHDIIDLWEEIEPLLSDAERECLPAPATEEELEKAEKKMELGIPEDLRMFLRYCANGSGYNLPGDVVFASTSEMLEQFSYNVMLPGLFRGLSWLPMGLIDCDFCWRAMDIRSGQMLYIDFECHRYKIEAPSFRSVLQNFLSALKKRQKRMNISDPAAVGEGNDTQFSEDLKEGQDDLDLRGDDSLFSEFLPYAREMVGGI